jgi:hypothetical protein
VVLVDDVVDERLVRELPPDAVVQRRATARRLGLP